jgi:hypothetical protein
MYRRNMLLIRITKLYLMVPMCQSCHVMMRFVTLSLVVIMISGFLSRRGVFNDVLCISDYKASSNSVIDE